MMEQLETFVVNCFRQHLNRPDLTREQILEMPSAKQSLQAIRKIFLEEGILDENTGDVKEDIKGMIKKKGSERSPVEQFILSDYNEKLQRRAKELLKKH